MAAIRSHQRELLERIQGRLVEHRALHVSNGAGGAEA
jgi:hypothetical protein